MNNYSGLSLGRYHILEPLGEGGMAIVYRAYDTRLECDVAVKFIRSQKLSGENSSKVLKRFKNEAKKTAGLMHPNIVPVIDYGEYVGTPYLVMKYLTGGTLKKALIDRLKNGEGPYPYQQAAALLAPIAHALELAHQNGIIHRDVKPSNILLTQTGQPMLTDFGVARIIESDVTMDHTGTGVGVGTPEYMAPEQWEGKEIDGRADVYGLGVVFYELITGRVPFRADTVPAILIKVLRDPLPRPREFVKGLPESVEKVLFKALSKDSKERYANMAIFAATLEKLAIQGVTRIPERKLERSGIKSDTHLLEPIERFDDRKEEAERILKPPRSIAVPCLMLPTWVWAVLAGIGLLGLIVIISLVVNPKAGKGLAALITTRTPMKTPSRTEVVVLAAKYPTAATSTVVSLKTPSLSSTPSQTTQLIIPSGAKLTFNNDFETGQANGFRPKDGIWKVVTDITGNKVYEADNGSGSNFIWTEFGPLDFSDGTIQYRFKYIDYDSKTDNSGLEYIFFRTRGDWNGDSYTLQFFSYYSGFSLNYVPAEGSAWPEIGSFEFSITKNTWYLVRIEAIGNHFNVYIDGKLLIDANDSSNRLKSGRLGFQVSPHTIVQFDDVQIWQ